MNLAMLDTREHRTSWLSLVPTVTKAAMFRGSRYLGESLVDGSFCCPKLDLAQSGVSIRSTPDGSCRRWRSLVACPPFPSSLRIALVFRTSVPLSALIRLDFPTPEEPS